MVKLNKYRVQFPDNAKLLLGIPRVCRRYGHTEEQALAAAFVKDGGYDLTNPDNKATFKELRDQINHPDSQVRITALHIPKENAEGLFPAEVMYYNAMKRAFKRAMRRSEENTVEERAGSDKRCPRHVQTKFPFYPKDVQLELFI
jgi:hypothetical protein